MTLAKSVLGFMPIYTMQNLWIPEGVCDKINSSIRQFIWGVRSSHWVNWNKVTRPIKYDDLGVRTARMVNTSLLGKHVWEVIHHPEKLWVQLLSHKYLPNSFIFDCLSSVGVSYSWKSIAKAASLLNEGFINRIGSGDLSLWYSKWRDKGCLCLEVPFVSIHDTNLRIKDVFYDGVWHFDKLYTQLPDDIKDGLQSVFIYENLDDLLIWGLSSTGEYSAKSTYEWLTNSSSTIPPPLES